MGENWETSVPPRQRAWTMTGFPLRPVWWTSEWVQVVTGMWVTQTGSHTPLRSATLVGQQIAVVMGSPRGTGHEGPSEPQLFSHSYRGCQCAWLCEGPGQGTVFITALCLQWWPGSTQRKQPHYSDNVSVSQCVTFCPVVRAIWGVYLHFLLLCKVLSFHWGITLATPFSSPTPGSSVETYMCMCAHMWMYIYAVLLNINLFLVLKYI